jgi:hypothetical protein
MRRTRVTQMAKWEDKPKGVPCKISAAGREAEANENVDVRWGIACGG